LRESKQKEIEMQSKQKTFSIDSFNSESSVSKKIINLIIKSDVQGSAEAIVSSLKAIKNDDVGLDIIYSGVGAITESDANLAMSSNSKIIGFNLKSNLLFSFSDIETVVVVISYPIIDTTISYVPDDKFVNT